jgi:tetratricopeptide (TPR) repeat protein
MPKFGFLPRRSSTATMDDPIAFVQLAQAALKDGHHERAAAYAKQAVGMDAKLGEGHFLLALVDADRGHFDSAETHVQKAISCSPLEVRVHHLASIISSERGQWEQAITHLKKCVFLDRHFVLGHFGLAVALRETKSAPESARYLKNVLTLLEDVSDDATLPGVDDIAAGWLKKVSKKYLRDIEETRSSK